MDDAMNELAEAPAAAPPPYKPPGKAAATAAPAAAGAAASSGSASSGKAGALELITNFIPDNDNWKWWYYIIAGIAMVPVSFFQYFRLLDYEKGEGRLDLKSFERILYGIFGKWGVCGFLILIGAFMIFIGLGKFQKEKREHAASS